MQILALTCMKTQLPPTSSNFLQLPPSPYAYTNKSSLPYTNKSSFAESNGLSHSRYPTHTNTIHITYIGVYGPYTHKYLSTPIPYTYQWSVYGNRMPMVLIGIVLIGIVLIGIVHKASHLIVHKASHLWAIIHIPLQHIATQCNKLQHNATHRITLQHALWTLGTRQQAIARPFLLYLLREYPATHCNTLWRAATHRQIPTHIRCA